MLYVLLLFTREILFYPNNNSFCTSVRVAERRQSSGLFDLNTINCQVSIWLGYIYVGDQQLCRVLSLILYITTSCIIQIHNEFAPRYVIESNIPRSRTDY